MQHNITKSFHASVSQKHDMAKVSEYYPLEVVVPSRVTLAQFSTSLPFQASCRAFDPHPPHGKNLFCNTYDLQVAATPVVAAAPVGVCATLAGSSSS